jgi:hypothetical protein
MASQLLLLSHLLQLGAVDGGRKCRVRGCCRHHEFACWAAWHVPQLLLLLHDDEALRAVEVCLQQLLLLLLLLLHTLLIEPWA